MSRSPAGPSPCHRPQRIMFRPQCTESGAYTEADNSDIGFVRSVGAGTAKFRLRIRRDWLPQVSLLRKKRLTSVDGEPFAMFSGGSLC